MTIKELLKLIEELQVHPETYIYINYEQNYEDEFVLVRSDTDNLLLVPKCKFEELKDSQEFSFII